MVEHSVLSDLGHLSDRCFQQMWIRSLGTTHGSTVEKVKLILIIRVEQSDNGSNPS